MIRPVVVLLAESALKIAIAGFGEGPLRGLCGKRRGGFIEHDESETLEDNEMKRTRS